MENKTVFTICCIYKQNVSECKKRDLVQRRRQLEIFPMLSHAGVMTLWRITWLRAVSRHQVRLLWYPNQCPSSNLTAQLWWNRAEQPGCPHVLLHTPFLPLADCQCQIPHHHPPITHTQRCRTEVRDRHNLRVNMNTRFEILRLDFGFTCLTSTGMKSPFSYSITHTHSHSHSHTLRPNMVEAGYFTSQQVWSWPSHIACQGKAISYILSAISLHSVWEDPQDAVTLPHRDQEEDPSAHHIRPNEKTVDYGT